MAYPFVASHVRLGRARKRPALAFIVHMAEGGGTVGYLSRPNPNGVSVHFVVEYSGRVVRMLDLTEMHSSIRASSIRTTDDADGRYGASHARAVMGAWADLKHGTSGPNHASIAVEVEGFARYGPNPKQNAALAGLFLNLAEKHPGIRALGHRDFANYKACPGPNVAWRLVGGHGAPAIEVPDAPDPDGKIVEDDVVIIREFPSPVPASIDASTRSFTFDEVTGRFREITKLPAGEYVADGTVRFLRDVAPKGTFVRIVTGPNGRRLVSGSAVDLG